MTSSLVIYWDASAVVSALFQDEHSDRAWRLARQEGLHLLSTLAAAEVHAVIARFEPEEMLADVLVQAARDAFTSGTWRLLYAQPSAELLPGLARRSPLRGAALWHLALAKTLHRELPELRLLTFDQRLPDAAARENLIYG